MTKVLGLVVASGAVLMVFAPAARAQTIREVSRSSPIVATVGGVEAQYQGSVEVVTPAPAVTTFTGAADATTFQFPHTLGHLRAVDIDDIPTTPTPFELLPRSFDVADLASFPPIDADGCIQPFTFQCRTIFTTIEAPDVDGLAQAPDRILVNTANLVQLKPLLAPTLADADVSILIERLLAGIRVSGGYRPALGGIDRSTMAIIEPSPVTPLIAGEERPTMIYVGALDGMLHAICAEARGVCLAAGQELWAFIPRTQLGALRFNTQRIDGSVKVADVFDDFVDDAVVLREFRTVLTLQTGSGNAAAPNLQPSVIALDVSNPGLPLVLWERSTPASRDTVDQGVGLGLAMGQTRVAGQLRNFTFVQTNNGGTGQSGFYLAAIDTGTGKDAWTYLHTYPASRNPANPRVPATGIPGGVAAFDADQGGLVTHISVTSLYGDLWVMEADGDRPYLDEPIFRFSTDFHPIGAPPTIYSDLTTSRLHAIAVSGGYADPVSNTWLQAGDDHFAVSVVIDPQAANVPMDEGATDFGEDRAFVINLGTDRRANAQAIVAGNELFITTDSTDVNLATYGELPDTGALGRYSLTDGGIKGSAVTIAGGGSATDVTAAGVVYTGGGGGAMRVDVGTTGGGGAFDAVGGIIERRNETSARLLWLNG